jgi:hypothetical protein
VVCEFEYAGGVCRGGEASRRTGYMIAPAQIWSWLASDGRITTMRIDND